MRECHFWGVCCQGIGVRGGGCAAVFMFLGDVLLRVVTTVCVLFELIPQSILEPPFCFHFRVCVHVCTGAPVVPLARRVLGESCCGSISDVWCMYLELAMHLSLDCEGGSRGR